MATINCVSVVQFWSLYTHNYTLNYLVSGLVHHLVFWIEYILGSISFSMLRWKGGEVPTYLGVLQRAITDHWQENQIISKALYQEVSFYMISFCMISLSWDLKTYTSWTWFGMNDPWSPLSSVGGHPSRVWSDYVGHIITWIL